MSILACICKIAIPFFERFVYFFGSAAKISLTEVRLLRYEPECMELINTAHRKARELGHSYVGSAHLLLALLSQHAPTGQLLRQFGLDALVAEDMTALFYGKGTALLPLPQGLSREAKAILRGAAEEARRQSSREVFPGSVLP